MRTGACLLPAMTDSLECQFSKCWCENGDELCSRSIDQWVALQTQARRHPDQLYGDNQQEDRTKKRQDSKSKLTKKQHRHGIRGRIQSLLRRKHTLHQAEMDDQRCVGEEGSDMDTYLNLLQYFEDNMSFYADGGDGATENMLPAAGDSDNDDGMVPEELAVVELTEELKYVNAVIRKQRLEMLTVQEQIQIVNCQLEEKKEVFDYLKDMLDNVHGEIYYTKKKTEIQECFSYQFGDLPRHIKRTSIELNKTIALKHSEHFPRALSRDRGKKGSGHELMLEHHDEPPVPQRIANESKTSDHVTTV